MPYRAVRRARGAVRRWLRGAVPVWHHPSFRLPVAGLQATSGIDPRRAENVLTWALDRGVLLPADVRLAEEAPWSWIALVHEADYLAQLDRPEALARIVSIEPHRLSTGPLLETLRRGVGGTVAAAQHVVAHGGRAACLLGGFHHAAPASGGGFSAVNDVAVAVRRLRDGGFTGHILVIDVDAHPPDGIAAALRDDAAVGIASLGVSSSWDVPENVIDVRVPPGTDDAGYHAALDALLRQLPQADLAFHLAGADPLHGDRFGQLACTETGLRERDRRILGWLRSTPTVLLPAGGYTPGAWRVFANAVAEAARSAEAPAADYDPMLRRSRDIARTLDPQDLGLTDELLTADDLEDLGMPVSEHRVLGAYTRQGIEHALSRYGILPALARMGFRGLEVTTVARGAVHHIRVLGDVNGLREPLLEMSISRKTVDGFGTLFVEWLALRDPRVPFTPDRPRLPGQDAPGLGLAEDAGHLLMRMAERLDLAGVSFVPAHYHVAWIARRRFIFIDPRARGRFRALTRHLAGTPLLAASHRLDDAGLPTRAGEPVRWEPSLMVYPVDPHLAEWLARSEPLAATEEASLEERLLPHSST
jgi:acetoin utilization deacetylase AcuC-like enzyme